MSRPPPLPPPADIAGSAAEDRDRHRRALNELVDLGMDLARAVHQSATADQQATPDPQAVASFDRLARTVRRTVLLLQKLDELPLRPNRTEARRELIRRVEDRIQSHREGPNAETLRAELAERLDAPELADDLARMPVAAIITEICRDLGLENDYGMRPYQRRTPRDVADLHPRAAHEPHRPTLPRLPGHPGHNQLSTPPPPG